MYDSLNEIFFLATRHKFRFVPAAGVNWQGDFDHGKQPMISIHQASSDETQLKAWATMYKGCNWIHVPNDAEAVLDVDPRHGGDALLARLETENGPLPRTVRSRTGGGGWHYYFTSPPGLQVKQNILACEGLTLAAGSRMGVVVPPSRHRSGGVYSWDLAPWDGARAAIPDWLLQLATGKMSSHSTVETTNPFKAVGSGCSLADHPGAEDGDRNRIYASLLGVELNKRRNPEDVWWEAVAFGERCLPPLTDAEIKNPFNSLVRKEEAKTEVGGGAEQHAHPHTDDAVSEGTNLFGLPNGLIPDGEVQLTSLTQAGEPGTALSSLTHVEAETCESGEKLTSLTHDEFLRHGLIRELAAALEPQLEGRIEPVVFCLLSSVGNAIGPAAGLMTQGDAQPGRIWAVCVAPSGAGKSEPFGATNMLMKMACAEWSDRCVCHGLGSGPGLVERVRDERTEMQPRREKGVVVEYIPVTIPGSEDKRCLVHEAEFGRVLTLIRGKDSTLGQTLCSAWDGRVIEVSNREANRLRATGHHISMWANITGEELAIRLDKSLEAVNGIGNRFLWIKQERVRHLPFGGDWRCLTEFAPAFARAIATARTITGMTWNDEAKKIWAEAYPGLCRTQERHWALGRARAQALRLIVVYALLDGSAIIEPIHVSCGLSAWAWAEASALSIFSVTANANDRAEPDASLPLWQKALDRICGLPGIGRTELLRSLKVKAEELTTALKVLVENRLAYSRVEVTGGRQAERWFLGAAPDDTRVEAEDSGPVIGLTTTQPTPPCEAAGPAATHAILASEGSKVENSGRGDHLDLDMAVSEESKPEVAPRPILTSLTPTAVEPNARVPMESEEKKLAAPSEGPKILPSLTAEAGGSDTREVGGVMLSVKTLDERFDELFADIPDDPQPEPAFTQPLPTVKREPWPPPRPPIPAGYIRQESVGWIPPKNEGESETDYRLRSMRLAIHE
ncbi:MAG: bifunctional DNA primase/polymerase [Planctomycetes bacterium]|nr:bifunctional DNA primase/polymerase [Planctomycetota bacterium]